MKRLILIIMSLVFLTACSNPLQGLKDMLNQQDNVQQDNNSTTDNNTDNTSPQTVDTSTNYTVKDYYPLKENVRLKYAGTGNEFASKDVYVDIISGNRIQLRVINGGTTLGQVLEVKDGELRMITSRGEFYYRDDLTSTKNDTPEILLKEPIKKDNSWTLADGRKRYISAVDVNVTTTTGSYKAVEVTTEDGDSKTLDYYARNVGLVKSVYSSSGSEITTTLEKIETKASVPETIKFYYPEFSKGRVEYVKNKINLKTNDEIKSIFEKYFKEPPNTNLSKVISANTKINKLYLNDKEHKVYVDFSKELISEMNAGTALESYIIKSITDTLGDYFNVDKVYVTVEGKPYSSGHIAQKSNQCFFVDYNNISEYQK